MIADLQTIQALQQWLMFPEYVIYKEFRMCQCVTEPVAPNPQEDGGECVSKMWFLYSI